MVHLILNMGRKRFWNMFVVSLILSTCCGTPWVNAQTQELGSTATLEDLKLAAQRRGEPSDPEFPKPEVITFAPIATVSVAAFPTPQLKYRFAPHPNQLRPGNAYQRFARALLMMPPRQSAMMKNWDMFQRSHAENEMPIAAEIDKYLFTHVLEELKEFLYCEDLSYDLRLRDKPVGKDGLSAIYGTLLPDAQAARDLAKILHYQCSSQLQKGDFSGAVQSIQTGFRLAAMLHQGEFLSEQLMAIAIEGTMYDCVRQAIQTPACPNLFFALATLPDHSRQLARSVEFELANVEKLLPFLEDAENLRWEPSRWKEEWRAALEGIRASRPNEAKPNEAVEVLRMQIQWALSSNGGQAKRYLIEDGEDPKAVEQMCEEQAIAIHTARELKTARALVSTPFFLSAYPGAILQRENEKLLAKGLHEPRSSISRILLEQLAPACTRIHNAQNVNVATQNHLMTLELIRDFAATNQGRLPRSLDEIQKLPLILDPFTNGPLIYEIKTDAQGEYAELAFAGPDYLPESQRVFRLRIQ